GGPAGARQPWMHMPRRTMAARSQFELLRVAATKGTALAPASCVLGRVAARRALVVEDDGQLRAVVAEYLRGEGFVVDEAGDGGGALSAARDAPPDVLVLDMQMPAMDGAAVLAGWNESPALKAVPVVVVSGAPDL